MLNRPDGKTYELDVIAKADDGRTVLTEVKKRQTPLKASEVVEFWDKVQLYQSQQAHETALPVILSLGGFNSDALTQCAKYQIGTATDMAWI